MSGLPGFSEKINLLNKEARNLGLNFNHIFMVGGAAAILILITFMKGGFNVDYNSATAQQNAGKKLTYEQALEHVRNKKETQLNGESSIAKKEEGSVLASLDQNYKSAQVLGASTEDLIPDSSTYLSEEQLNKIEVRIIKDNSKEALQKYARTASYVESKHDSFSLVSNYMSDDNAQQKKVAAEAIAIVSELKGMDVPEVLVKYHKMRMAIYAAINLIAKSGFDDSVVVDRNSLGVQLLSFITTMDELRNEIQEKYNIDL